jgi:hypothetical protein
MQGYYESSDGTQIYEFDGETETPKNLKVMVTLVAEEQLYLPIFQDVMIMMTMRWSNSRFPDRRAISQELTF